jgi:hypothetical protein
MKIFVDFSIYSSPDSAYGNVTGALDMPESPSQGDSLNFAMSKLGAVPSVKGFRGSLKVESKDYLVAQDGQCILSLSDIVVDGEKSAAALMAYFEKGFGLMAYPYNIND